MTLLPLHTWNRDHRRSALRERREPLHRVDASLFDLLDDFLDRNEDALLEDVALELRVLLDPPVEI